MIPTISKGNIGSGSVGKSKTFKGLDKVMAEQEASYIAEQNAASLATGGNPTNVSGLSASSAEVAGIMSGSIPSNVNSASEIPESGFDPAQPNTKLPLAERVRRQE